MGVWRLDHWAMKKSLRHILKAVFCSQVEWRLHAGEAGMSVWDPLTYLFLFVFLLFFHLPVVLRQHDCLPKWDPVSKPIPCACLVTWHAHILVMNASCSPAISHVWSMLLLGTPFALEFLLTSLKNPSSFSLLLMLDSQGSVELSLLLLSFPGWFGLTFVALNAIYLLVPFKSLPSDSKAIYPSLYLTSPITWIKYFSNWTPPKWILILPAHLLQFSLSHSMAPSLMELHSWTSWNCPWHLSFFFYIYNPK